MGYDIDTISIYQYRTRFIDNIDTIYVSPTVRTTFASRTLLPNPGYSPHRRFAPNNYEMAVIYSA